MGSFDAESTPEVTLSQIVFRRARVEGEDPCDTCGRMDAHECDLGVTASTADGSIQIHAPVNTTERSALRRLRHRFRERQRA